MRTVSFPRIRGSILAALLLMVPVRVASAGMPAPLPTDVDRYLVWRVNDSILGRVQAMSFFVVALLVCTAVVRWLWNSLQKGVPRLPRLSYGKALFGVLLWRLLFIVVLTMMSGGRLVVPIRRGTLQIADVPAVAGRKEGYAHARPAPFTAVPAPPLGRR